MSYVCAVLLGNFNVSIDPSETKTYNVVKVTTESITHHQHVQDYTSRNAWDFTDYSKNVLIPILCICGCVGNLLNLLILGMRIKEGR